MITELTIKNLRCFKELSLDKITPVTLISGENNVGKTTLLESIFLLFGYHNVDVFFRVNDMRGIAPVFQVPFPQGHLTGLSSPLPWETLFTDMDMARKLQISVKDNADITSSVCFEKDAELSLMQFSMNKNMNNMLQPVPGSYILNISYEHNSENKGKGRFVITQNGLVLNFDINSQVSTHTCFYIGPNIHFFQHPTVDWLGKVEREDKKAQIVDALRILDDKISDIFAIVQNGIVDIYAKWNTGKSRPIKTLGSGINKLLNYLLVMIANPGSVILLDEIESGFHYSFYPKLWELITVLSKKTQCQVFATTHSYECINAAIEGIVNFDSSLLTYFRLGKEYDRIVPFHFSEEDLAYALGREMEVR